MFLFEELHAVPMIIIALFDPVDPLIESVVFPFMIAQLRFVLVETCAMLRKFLEISLALFVQLIADTCHFCIVFVSPLVMGSYLRGLYLVPFS